MTMAMTHIRMLLATRFSWAETSTDEPIRLVGEPTI
jgi:hypothetical protein